MKDSVLTQEKNPVFHGIFNIFVCIKLNQKKLQISKIANVNAIKHMIYLTE